MDLCCLLNPAPVEPDDEIYQNVQIKSAKQPDVIQMLLMLFQKEQEDTYHHQQQQQTVQDAVKLPQLATLSFAWPKLNSEDQEEPMTPSRPRVAFQAPRTPPAKSKTSAKVTQKKPRQRLFHSCHFEGCDRAIQSRGFCKRHGGGVRCTFGTCTKGAVSKRRCRTHGGGARCVVEGCTKWAQRRKWCVRHSHDYLE